MHLTALVLATLPLVPSPQDAPTPPPNTRQVGGEGVVADENQVQVVYLANAGFMVRSGNLSIVIDAFMDGPTNGQPGLPKKTFRQLQAGKKPFNGFVMALASHAHPDHVSPRVVEKFLGANGKAGLATSPDVVQYVRAGAKDFAAIEQQLRFFNCPPGASKALDRGPLNMGVEFMNIPHVGEEGNADITNYAHLINVGGHKLLHLGDAAPVKSAFVPFGFPSRDIDVLFVPYWFYGSAEGVEIINDVISPIYVIVYHVPEAEQELFSERMELENPGVIVFGQALESKIFDKSEAGKAPADGPSDSDGDED